MIEYYSMMEAKTYEGKEVWLGIHPEGIEIMDLTGELIVEYLTTVDPMSTLKTIH